MTTKEIKELQNEIISFCELIYKNEEEANATLQDIVKKISEGITCFMEDIPRFNQLGANIPENVVVQQLENMLNAIETKDNNQLVDTLKYELLNSFYVYEELLEQVVE